MPSRYRHRILSHLAHDNYRPTEPADIARQMLVDGDDRPAFDEAMTALVDEEFVQLGRDGKARLPEYPEEITGRFRLNERGFGFVLPDRPYRHGDLFVPRGSTGDAVSRDTVRVQVRRQERGRGGGRSPYVGRIVEVLEPRAGCVRRHPLQGEGLLVRRAGRAIAA